MVAIYNQTYARFIAVHVGTKLAAGLGLEMHQYSANNWYWPIISQRITDRFAHNWYRPIVVYTTGKYKFLFLLSKVNKHESGFHFR